MLTIQEVRNLRIKHKITQKDFAELLDIPIGTWSNVELGNSKFQNYMKVRVKELLDDLGIWKATPVEREIIETKPYVEPVEEEGSQLTKEQLFDKIAFEIADTLIKKNHDYGDSFHDVYSEFGDLSTFIRLKDKLGRLETHVKGGEFKVDDESVIDIYKDIAGYCILTLTSKERLKGEIE